MFSERLPHLPPEIPDFAEIPPATDRQAWTSLPVETRDQLIARAEEVARTPWPALPATLHMAFTRNGNRSRFEAAYQGRRNQLNALILGECVENEGRFLDQIVDGIWLICEESGWQIAAHNCYARGGRRFPLPDTTAPVIDLFASETGAQLAVAATLLAESLDRISPEIVRRIDRELQARIVQPYHDAHFWWMGGEGDPLNNWTGWCTQNVLLTVLTRPTDQQTRRAVIEKAAKSLDEYLSVFGDDGGCEEGVMYYRKGSLTLFNALVVLAAVAPDVFAGLWREPKLRNMAEYIVNMHVDDNQYFNFSDSSAVVGRCTAREYLFGLAVGSDALTDFAVIDWAKSDEKDLPDEYNLFYRLQAAFNAQAMRERAASEPEKRDILYESIGLMIARDDRYALAVKAGHNGESHNHNDVGSVTLYKDGRPFLIDVGVETYTAKTFSGSRYEIWTMQSAYHNLLTFDDVMQRDGRDFAAANVKAELSPAAARMEMELAGAYPAEAGLRSYRRCVHFTKGRDIEVVDTFDSDRPATLSLMFAEEPVIEGDAIKVGGLGAIAIDGGGAPRSEAIPIADERLLWSWPTQLWRVLVPVAGQRLALRIQ